ncbi:Olfr543 [Phodopus roborovskii]|uniref:Olfactory receptor n=1 Tax=Phodopus roborovskii TaxID=109678 RepID=A0AAU9ZN75_PHORO|nr:Olfr543 [Phodopus roborovskii]
MSEDGNTSIFNFSYTSFLLVGFPGLREGRPLLALHFAFLYVSIVSANALDIHTVVAQRSLHQPMYVLIALLLAVNICASTAVMPKMLEGFVHYANPISLRGCLAQMFFIYFTLLLDYNLLLAMAIDRYVAICHPLRYTELMTSHLLGLIATFALTRSLGVAVPLVVLTAKARFCRTPSTAERSLWRPDLQQPRLGLAMRLVTVTFDLALLGTSYTRIIYAAFQLSSGGARAKALHTCGSHLLTVSQDVQNLLSAIYLLLPGALNPLIYGMRTKEIRQHIEKMLCGKQPPQDIGEKSQTMRGVRELPG